MRLIFLFAASSALLGCSAATETPPPAEQFAALFGKTFQTRVNSDQAIIRDRRVRINSAALPGVWFYSQMNTGEDFKLYRQRIFNIVPNGDGKGLVQRAYVLNDAAAFEDAWDNPALLNALTADDFEPLFSPDCDPKWTAQDGGDWTGYVDPKLCVIESKRRNMQIRIESESTLSANKYQTTERGFDTDMNFLWGSKPGEINTLFVVEP